MLEMNLIRRTRRAMVEAEAGKFPHTAMAFRQILHELENIDDGDASSSSITLQLSEEHTAS